MTNAEIGEKYQQMSIELSQIIAKLEDMRQKCALLSDETQDARDPQFAIEDVLSRIGIALATIVSYAHEYATEFEDHKDNEEAGK